MTTTLPQATTPTRTFALGGLVASLRPQQWVKNGFVFAALIFSRSITDWHRNARVAAGAFLFCLISSAVYLLNDILDAPEDRKHPLRDCGRWLPGNWAWELPQ